MKRISILALLLIGTLTSIHAQHQIRDFFDAKTGLVTVETKKIDNQRDSLIYVPHRADDVVWSRVVYRIIDMRFKQNYQLYHPAVYEAGSHDRNLLKVIVDAVIDGLPIYYKSDNEGVIKPSYIETMKKADIREAFALCEDKTRLSNLDEQVIRYDTVSDQLSFNPSIYDAFVRNQLKYLVQELVFFDKHYSRVYSKILAIAPLHADKIESEEPIKALYESILCWIPFKTLTPYLAAQDLISTGDNDNKKDTYATFFDEKQYSSYIVGDNNVYDRMFINYAKTPEAVNKEQQRVFDNLLNFELDLWAY